MALPLRKLLAAPRCAPLVGGALVLVLSASSCSLAEEAKGASPTPDSRQTAAGTAGDSGPPEPSTTLQVIAGLGAPLAALVDGAGVPGLGDSSTTGTEVSPEQQSCLEREASTLPPEDLRTITTNGAFGDLSLPGASIVRNAISTCLPDDVLAARISEEYVAWMNATPQPGDEPDPKLAEFTTCIQGGLADNGGELIVQVAKLTATDVNPRPEPIREIVDPCANPLMEQRLINELANEGYDYDGAACITFGFLGRTTVSDYLDYGGLEGELPPILAIDLKELRENCGPPKQQ
ncbi:MAG: hypothetical protein R2754_08640 [Microthrixaceae bacterium]